MKVKFLFLYSELAEYFLACIKALVAEYPAEIHIVRWPLNKEAPFEFNIPDGVHVYDKQQYTLLQLVELAKNINPSLIFCSGWIDKDYLAVVRAFKKEIPAVVGIDNHWQASLKQHVARLLAPFTLQRIFTHAFVAGKPQMEYARKLSFSDNRVILGYYAADVPYFRRLYFQNKDQKVKKFPKRFIYVGRYVEHKGVKDLWEAFEQLHSETFYDWELWCLGTGPLESEAPNCPGIKHFGFIQPDQMANFTLGAGVFVLPSHFEPWGVVVHEFAAAGFPLLCSDKVGAASAFLEEGKNGFCFEAGNVADLKLKLKQFMRLSEDALLSMGDRSAELSLQNTPQEWSKKLMSLTKK